MTEFWIWFTAYPQGIGLAPWEWCVAGLVSAAPLIWKAVDR